MITWPLEISGQIARGWTQIYTAGLPTKIRIERKAEIKSDLWEQAIDGVNEGRRTSVVAAHIFARTTLGIPADVAWHLGELKGADMHMSFGQRSAVGVFIVLGVASVFFALALGVSGDGFNGWQDIAFGLLALMGIVGPIISIAGVYAWRRANAEGRSTKKAQTLIIVGTLGIAGLAGMMYWTLIGPLIAVAVVTYWIFKIRNWRGENRRAA